MEDRARTELQNALRRILRPLVRILLRQGFSIGEFTELVKRAYMEVAWDEFTPEGARPSDSRVAIMTGLTRKEVKRLRETRDDDDSSLTQQLNRGSRVLSGWYRDPEFCDEHGEPLSLSLDGADSGFSKLVKRYSGDMPPRAMLDELLRVGAVRLDGAQVSVLSRSFIPSKGDPDHLRIFGTSVSDLAANWDHNLQAEDKASRIFQGHAYSKSVSAAAYPIFKKLVNERGQAFLETIEEWLLSHESDSLEPGATKEIGVGLYLLDREESGSQHNDDHH